MDRAKAKAWRSGLMHINAACTDQAVLLSHACHAEADSSCHHAAARITSKSSHLNACERKSIQMTCCLRPCFLSFVRDDVATCLDQSLHHECQPSDLGRITNKGNVPNRGPTSWPSPNSQSSLLGRWSSAQDGFMSCLRLGRGARPSRQPRGRPRQHGGRASVGLFPTRTPEPH